LLEFGSVFGDRTFFEGFKRLENEQELAELIAETGSGARADDVALTMREMARDVTPGPGNTESGELQGTWGQVIGGGIGAVAGRSQGRQALLRREERVGS
jgi:hypothetical protein